MKESKLTRLCVSMGIPRREITPGQMECYSAQKVDESTLVKYMEELDQLMGGRVIVMGGFSASSPVLGFRRMRRVSNDLDCVTDEEGVKLLYQQFDGKLFQTTNFGTLFVEYKGIPVDFDVNETHGWTIPPAFFEDVVRFNFNGGGFNSISPEFLLALKARRSIRKNRFYGKDAIDTANVLLAPLYRSGLAPIDFKKLAFLMKSYSSEDLDNLSQYIQFVSSYQDNLKKKESLHFTEQLARISL